MSPPTWLDERAEPRGLWISGVLVLTSLHHVYGAIHYFTLWRYHAVQLSVVTLAVILTAYWLSHRKLVGRTESTPSRAQSRAQEEVSEEILLEK